MTVNGTDAKPSREIKTQDIVTFKVGPLEKKVQVLQILEKRISAKLVDQYLKDLTPQSSYQEAEVKKRAIISSPFEKEPAKDDHQKKKGEKWKISSSIMKTESIYRLAKKELMKRVTEPEGQRKTTCNKSFSKSSSKL